METSTSTGSAEPKFNIKKIVIWGLVGLFAFITVVSTISTSNSEVDLRNRFKQHMDQRTAFYDKMWKTISGKGQVALKNDSSFQKIVNMQVTGQKGGDQLMMQWVTQSNPAATFEQVTLLYADLSRAIESERDGFFMEEKMIQGIVYEHDNILGKFPSGFILGMFGRKSLEYKPITSTRTDEVMKTGKDDNDKVF